jgi:hypothetical protein
VIDQLFAWFAKRGELSFTIAAIDEWAKPYLRDMVAHRAAPEFTVVDTARLQTLGQQASDAWDIFRDRGFVIPEIQDTEEQLVVAVLQHLGKIGHSEIASEGERDVILRYARRAFAQLSRSRSITFDETNIPDRAFVPIRDYVASMCATALGVSDPNMLLLLKAQAADGERELRAQTMVAKGHEPIRGTFF